MAGSVVLGSWTSAGRGGEGAHWESTGGGVSSRGVSIWRLRNSSHEYSYAIARCQPFHSVMRLSSNSTGLILEARSTIFSFGSVA